MSGSLISPGSLVTFTDDTMGVSSTTGTVPLFVIGTHENKTQTSSSTIAPYTATGTGGNVYVVNSQRELVTKYGDPIFYTSNGTPQNAYELNEYGLLAAYQYLGLANSAYILRADIDYYQLAPTTSAPYSSLINKTFWLNSSTSSWGIFMNDGTNSSTSWTNQTPYVLSDDTNMSWTIRGQVGWPDVSSTTLGEGVTFGANTYAGISANSSFTISLETGQSVSVPYVTTDTLSDVYQNIKTALNGDSYFDTVSVEYVSYNSTTESVTCTPNQNANAVYPNTAWTLGTVYTNTGTSTSPTYTVSPPSAGTTYTVADNNEITTTNVVNGTTLTQTISIVPVGSSSKATTVTNVFTLVYAIDSTNNVTYLESYTFVEQKQNTIEQGIYLQIVQSSITRGLSISGSADIMKLIGFYEPTTTTKTVNYTSSSNAEANQAVITVSGDYSLDEDQTAIITQNGTGAEVSISSTSITNYSPNLIVVSAGGTGYAVNDTVTIQNVGVVTVTAIGTDGAITTVTNKSTLTSTTDMSGTAIATATSGSGTGATFTVTTTSTVTYKSSGITLTSGGTGYAVGSVYYCENNDYFTVATVNGNGTITGITPTLDTNSYSTDMASTSYSIINAIPANTTVMASIYDSSSNTSSITLDYNLVKPLSSNVVVTIVTTTTEETTPSENVTGLADKIPNSSYGNSISGQSGIFTIVSGTAIETDDTTTYGYIKMYQKVGGSYIDTGVINSSTGVEYTDETSYAWMLIGSDEWKTISGNSFNFVSSLPTGSFSSGDIVIKTSANNNGSNIVMNYYDPSATTWVTKACNIYESDEIATLNVGNSDYSVYAQYQLSDSSNPEAFYIVKVQLSETWYDLSTETYTTNVVLHGTGISSNVLSYYFQSNEPEGDPEDGTMWYNTDFFADIMVGDGENWYGYRNYYPETDANGPILSASKPTMQSTGDALVDNDLWINTSDTENYPLIYRYSASTNVWSQIDNTNHSDGYGIIFEDARWTDNGSNSGSQLSSDLVVSNYLDPDAPDPRLYQKGTLLFNTRASTYNVKVWRENWLSSEYNGTDYLTRGYTIGQSTSTENLGTYSAVASAGRWVTDSGNDETGAPYMGRKAQRQIIVEAMKAAVTDNDDIRSENIYFTLISAPGYPELISDMVELNVDKNYTGFVVGDTPARLASDTTSLTNYATNTTALTDGDDGIVTSDSNLSVYYPWGLSTNTDGTTVMVPPSHMAIYTIAYSDSISYPWYAPAGTTRGLIKNASAVGYLDSASGNFISVSLGKKQNDILYPNNINAILNYTNTGLVIMGDKTRCADSTSALSRINQARLMSYIRYNLTIMTRRYLFEQNIPTTRSSAKSLVDKFFTNLVSLNAVTDYITVCDTSNNTADTIDNNELHIDSAYVGTRTIDFIYVPVRLENTGTDLSSLYSTTTS